MFPLEAEFLAAKEAEHLRSLLLSGGYVQSDIDAGKKIGEEIGTKALTRASTDGMRSAQTPKQFLILLLNPPLIDLDGNGSIKKFLNDQ